MYEGVDRDGKWVFIDTPSCVIPSGTGNPQDPWEFILADGSRVQFNGGEARRLMQEILGRPVGPAPTSS